MELRHVAVAADGARRRLTISGTALSAAEAREIELVLADWLEDADGIRVLTIASAGADFCPGAASDLDPLHGGVHPVEVLARVPCPVVAVLTGEVASVGLELALAADIRVAGPTARLSLPDVHAGRLPCWGGTQRLPRAAGRSTAARMLLAGDVLDASEAAACGLVHAVADDPDAAAALLADQLESLAPLALAAAKEAIARGSELPMRHALELEGDLNHLLQTTADRAEGLAAFFAKRPPEFDGS